MSHEVHAVKRNGTYVYRIWSTITDGYLTDELPEAEAQVYEEQAAVEIAREHASRGWPRRAEAARVNGTSGLGKRRLDGWDVEHEEAKP